MFVMSVGVENILRKVHSLLSKICTTLAIIPDIPSGMLESGEMLTVSVIDAMRNNSRGLSINQSKEDVAGDVWWSGRLGNWMFSVLRLTRDRDSRFDQLRQEIDESDLSCIDDLRKVGESKEMTEKRIGPFKVIAVEKILLPELTSVDPDRIMCRVEGCLSVKGFTSEKARALSY